MKKQYTRTVHLDDGETMVVHGYVDMGPRKPKPAVQRGPRSIVGGMPARPVRRVALNPCRPIEAAVAARPVWDPPDVPCDNCAAITLWIHGTDGRLEGRMCPGCDAVFVLESKARAVLRSRACCAQETEDAEWAREHPL